MQEYTLQCVGSLKGIAICRFRRSPFMEDSWAVSWWLQLEEVKAERAYGDECGTDQLGKLEYA
jgi:hypothetical protein